ncbi:hypothetical protein FA95DRAFT_560143 [Auriscalpium vulgare]|uniref:Uncharacterized protein n=1 Tax=Auriscalpium vulgare TaxID=40419 RepID=A0ACB8REN1_9AGAM|nr:hypothetical protein FA95DRAFT_560143 [Auriscalpium vulgare]
MANMLDLHQKCSNIPQSSWKSPSLGGGPARSKLRYTWMVAGGSRPQSPILVLPQLPNFPIKCPDSSGGDARSRPHRREEMADTLQRFQKRPRLGGRFKLHQTFCPKTKTMILNNICIWNNGGTSCEGITIARSQSMPSSSCSSALDCWTPSQHRAVLAEFCRSLR